MSMRLAIVAASDYPQNSELAELTHVAAQLDLLGQRLAEPDAGFYVHIFSAERGLAEGIEQVLADVQEPIDSILFYFAGYAVVSQERGAALLLDGERLSTLSLKRVRRLLQQAAPRSFAILDTVSAFDGQGDPSEVVRLLGEQISAEDSGVNLLVSNRSELSDAGASPFTKLLELVLDWQSGGPHGLTAEALFAAMRAEEALFAELPAASFFRGREAFFVLAPGVAPAFSVAPPPDPRSAAERADALAAAGDHANALVDYTAALAELGPPPSQEHPPLYVKIARSLRAVGRDEDALAYFQAALEIDPRSSEALQGVAELGGSGQEAVEQLEQSGDVQTALLQVRATLRARPRDPAGYRAAMRLFDRAQDPEGAWQAACALEALGEADINESLLAGAHRPEGLLPARGRLSEEDWALKLFCPERDATLDGVFSFLDGAALEVGLETARRKRRLPALDPSTEQNPETSTATLAKTLAWTAKLIGVNVPKLYVVPELRQNLTHPPTLEPTLLVNRSIGSGLELPELAFLWGRQLTFLRPEHRLLSVYPSTAELAELLVAALSLGGAPELPFKGLDGDAKLFARGLKRHLSRDEVARLRAVVGGLHTRDLTARALAWTRNVELGASRAGLLACGSLEIAVRMSERFPLPGSLSPEEQVGDLLVWSLSPEHAKLRERLGVRVKP